MEEQKKVCRSCIHYRQHYILDSQRCSRVCCGHCVYPRIKHRSPENRACDYFKQCSSEDLPNRAETIDFLTKEVLQRILDMPLPPEITADEGFD